MVIGLALTLAISKVMMTNESSKRSTTSVMDIDQSASYSTYVLDRVIRSAGSGYAQNWSDAFGCTLSAVKAGTQILPRTTAWTGFANLPQTLLLAPVIIGKGQADTTGAGAQVRGDLITVMGGTGGFAESPQVLQTTTTTTPQSVNVSNVVGYRAGDLILLADSGVQGCMLEQIAAPVAATGVMQITGDYSNTTTSPASLGAYSNTSYVAQLGNLVPGATPPAYNPPEFITFGVTDNNVLGSYDLLQAAAGATDAPAELAEGVIEMRALYGIDTDNPHDSKVTAWIDPIVGSGYESSVLLNPANRAASKALLRNIIAVRVGLILRTSLPEKTAIVQPTTLTLFSDLPTAVHQTRTLSGADLNYRWKTVEVTIPLRNLLLAP